MLILAVRLTRCYIESGPPSSKEPPASLWPFSAWIPGQLNPIGTPALSSSDRSTPICEDSLDPHPGLVPDQHRIPGPRHGEPRGRPRVASGADGRRGVRHVADVVVRTETTVESSLPAAWRSASSRRTARQTGGERPDCRLGGWDLRARDAGVWWPGRSGRRP